MIGLSYGLAMDRKNVSYASASRSLFLGVILAGLASGAATGCGFTNYKNAADGTLPTTVGSNPGNNTATGAATFSEVSSQILQPSCLGCHGAGATSPDLSSYAGFATNTQWIAPGNPTGSAVYTAIQSGVMPKGGNMLTSAEISLMASWIQNGAQND